MLYHPDKKQLFIFAGQREHFLDDFLVYNTHNDTVEQVVCVDETKVSQYSVFLSVYLLVSLFVCWYNGFSVFRFVYLRQRPPRYQKAGSQCGLQ